MDLHFLLLLLQIIFTLNLKINININHAWKHAMKERRECIVRGQYNKLGEKHDAEEINKFDNSESCVHNNVTGLWCNNILFIIVTCLQDIGKMPAAGNKAAMDAWLENLRKQRSVSRVQLLFLVTYALFLQSLYWHVQSGCSNVYNKIYFTLIMILVCWSSDCWLSTSRILL